METPSGFCDPRLSNLEEDMSKLTKVVFSAALAISALSAAPGVSRAQESQQLLCENGSEAVLLCTYHRDANGNIVLDKCVWSC